MGEKWKRACEGERTRLVSVTTKRQNFFSVCHMRAAGGRTEGSGFEERKERLTISKGEGARERGMDFLEAMKILLAAFAGW